MADFGAVQSADAVLSLISLTKKIIEYCVKLSRARNAASRILDRIQGFRDVIHGPISLLDSHHAPRSDRVYPNERSRLLEHIGAAVGGCLQTLESIEDILRDVLDAEAGRLRKFNARRSFVGHTKEIHHLLNQLDGQKITLLIAFATIGLYNQQNQSQERNTEIQIRELTININYGGEYYRSLLNRPRPPELAAHHPALLEGDVPDDQPQTLRDLLSVRELAVDVLGRLRTVRAPAAPRRDSFAAQALLSDDSNATARSPPLAPSIPPFGFEGAAASDPGDSLLYTGIATGQKINSVSDPDVLKRFIEKFRVRAEESMENSDYDLAEHYLEKVIAYSEQRERLASGVAFSDRASLYEELAGVCKLVCNWTAAINILERLLSPDKPPDHDTDYSSNGTVVRYARYCQLLAAVYVDKCCMIFSEGDVILDCAFVKAQYAWSLWKKVRESRTLTSPEQQCRSECASLLKQIWTMSGAVEEASCFDEDILDQLPSPPTRGGPSIPAIDPSPSIRKRSSVSVHPDINRHRLDDYEAAKTAVKTTRPSELRRLFKLPDSPFSIDEKFTNGFTILHYAAAQGASTMVEEILRMGASITTQDDLHETALVKAITGDHHETVGALLRWQGGASGLNFTFSNGQSLLHYSIQHGALHSVSRLLEIDPNLVHLKDRLGRTALHQCAVEGKAETAGALLDYEANLAEEDSRHYTPGRYTLSRRDKNHQDVFQLLMEHSSRRLPGATETMLVDSLLNRKSLTRRESDTLAYYLKTFREQGKRSTRTASETTVLTVSTASTQGMQPPRKTKSNESESRSKKSIFSFRQG